MNTRTLFSATAILTALIPLQGGAVTQLNDEAIIGRIRSGDAARVRVCFDRGTAAAMPAGREFEVIRHHVRALPKGLTTLETAHAGVVRIVSAMDDQCASAAVVSGSAQAFDWVAARTSP